MDADPARQGQQVAVQFLEHALALFADLTQSTAWSALAVPAAEARREWQVFALYACVRGLVAGGGFNIETASAIDALHESVMERWASSLEAGESLAARRALIAARYQEYGAIGQAGGKSGAASVTQRLGEAAARHMTGAEPSPEIAELIGALHEELAEAVAAQVRGE